MPVCTIRTLCPVFPHPQLSTDSAISRGVCGSEIESQQKIPTKRDDADLLLIGSDFAPFFQLGNGLAGEYRASPLRSITTFTSFGSSCSSRVWISPSD